MSIATVPTITFTDTPRARRTDSPASHRAADRSQHNLKPTKLAVLRLVHQERLLTGEEINDLYSLRTVSPTWPAAKHDTPRKRAGELFNDGYLDAEMDPDFGRVYSLSSAGWDEIMANS